MDKPTSKLSRRTVFAGAGTAGALAAAAALLPKATVEAPVAETKPEADTAKGGYQVTQHVLRYYQTTRV
ncbi:formate dehydrogenase [Variovorax sp. YR752]|uniref:formate dehydrogenase n=1 Tax=Variovorax sp. YR752 TaxID=1884383 RepID=UPI0031382F12